MTYLLNHWNMCNNHKYGKHFCQKANTFLFLFSNKTLLIKAGIYKKLVIIANSETFDQTCSSEAV